MLKHTFSRARYTIGNCIRILNRPWMQSRISPQDATTIFGCTFGDDGWNHIRRTLQEIDNDPSISPLDTTLWQFLENFCPTSISILAGVTDEEPLPLFVYPWGTFNGGREFSDKDPWTSRFCGPSSKKFISDELTRTIQLYAQMRETGYQPTRYPNSYIVGTWLVAADGRRKFVVMQGNHRMGVLAHLKTTSVAVRTSKIALRTVREAELKRWPLVASGRCSPNHAKKVFDFFFEHTGWHVADQLN